MLFLKATLAGFVVAVPIGVIGAMCLRRAFQGRWMVALVTGFGAAIGDAILATAAMFGLSLIIQYVLDHQAPLRLVGGVFLIYLGVRMIQRRHPKLPVPTAAPAPTIHVVRTSLAAFATGFGLTIVNPATLLAFAGVFAGLGFFAERPEGILAQWAAVVGVLTGSMLWWLTLTGAACAVRHRMPTGIIAGINTVLGTIVIGFGVASLLSLVGVIV